MRAWDAIAESIETGLPATTVDSTENVECLKLQCATNVEYGEVTASPPVSTRNHVYRFTAYHGTRDGKPWRVYLLKE